MVKEKGTRGGPRELWVHAAVGGCHPEEPQVLGRGRAFLGDIKCSGEGRSCDSGMVLVFRVTLPSWHSPMVPK